MNLFVQDPATAVLPGTGFSHDRIKRFFRAGCGQGGTPRAGFFFIFSAAFYWAGRVTWNFNIQSCTCRPKSQYKHIFCLKKIADKQQDRRTQGFNSDPDTYTQPGHSPWGSDWHLCSCGIWPLSTHGIGDIS